MEATQLLAEVDHVLEKIANKYSVRGNTLMTAEDLLQQQRVKVLEIAAQPPCQGHALIRYTLRACKRTCQCLVRDNWRKAGRSVAANVDDYAVAEFLTDGTWEALRAQLEERERRQLLQDLTRTLCNPHARRIIREILNPSTKTISCLESGGTVKQALQAGTGVPFHMVRKSLTQIRKVLQAAA